jgi:4-alpha-glucanotransferase
MTPFKRSCGLLCHPTSLPGRGGIGDLGPGVDRFIDFMVAAGHSIWQILPLGPTGYGDSPYQPFSAYAGNPLLIDLDELAAAGLLTEEASPLYPFPEDEVRYGDVIGFKTYALGRAYERFRQGDQPALAAEIEAFAQANAHWLPDYALFMALKLRHGWAVWTDWPAGIARHESAAMAQWRATLAEEIGYQRFIQYWFDRQWRRAHAYAAERGVTIVGDIPIFMGHDSADVWSHQELFRLDEAGRPTVVAGVPPDYFSATGQLWGNPLYRWDAMQEDGYAWWRERLRAVLSRVDVVRLDHFRGFSGYWEVPAGEETAVNGRWVKGPGSAFFRAMAAEFGGLPIIAEDLGLITADVMALRDEFGLPGMRVLQFAFDSDAANVHLPHNYVAHCVAYTGTHDNDTTLGWFAARDEAANARVRRYAGDGEAHRALMRLLYTSVADLAIVPIQDALGLGSEARLNLPGRPHGNWTWRLCEADLSAELASGLRELARATGRWWPPDMEPPETGAPELEYEVVDTH